MSADLPSFNRKDKDNRPNIRLKWQETGPGPGEGETFHVSYLRQGFFAAVVGPDGVTHAITFVPRPKFKYIGDREIVEA